MVRYLARGINITFPPLGGGVQKKRKSMFGEKNVERETRKRGGEREKRKKWKKGGRRRKKGEKETIMENEKRRKN